MDDRGAGSEHLLALGVQTQTVGADVAGDDPDAPGDFGVEAVAEFTAEPVEAGVPQDLPTHPIGGAAPALADISNFGQQVRMCTSMMLPNDLNADGSITMTMPDGTLMSFRTFGAMVTFMRSHQMCS